MSKEVIHVYGQDIVVGDSSPESQKEDTWVLVPIVLFTAISVVLTIVIAVRIFEDPLTNLF